jgi:cation diffusion facilitator CzcD-associated flavoprotein CzcO
MHSACWDHSIDYKDKKVAVIGVGSTSVQITPALQPHVKNLEVFMRSPTWISPPFGAGALQTDLQKGVDVDPGQRQYKFSEEDKKKFASDPEYHLYFRKRIEAEINSLFGMYQQGSELSESFRTIITDEMHRRMGQGHEDLKKFIIPKFAPGCRRISPGDGFLEALVKPNVRPVFSGIQKITEKGIVTDDGEEHEFDIIVCATGFQVAFKPAFKVINGEGKSIDEDWADGVNLYFGVSAPRFPNYYTIVGPGATWSNGTLIPSIETTIEYAIQIMKKVQHEHIKAIEVKQEALNEIYAHFDEFHKTTVWRENCRSWFKDGKVKNRIYLWPGSVSPRKGHGRKFKSN